MLKILDVIIFLAFLKCYLESIQGQRNSAHFQLFALSSSSHHSKPVCFASRRKEKSLFDCGEQGGSTLGFASWSILTRQSVNSSRMQCALPCKLWNQIGLQVHAISCLVSRRTLFWMSELEAVLDVLLFTNVASTASEQPSVAQPLTKVIFLDDESYRNGAPAKNSIVCQCLGLRYLPVFQCWDETTLDWMLSVS